MVAKKDMKEMSVERLIGLMMNNACDMVKYGDTKGRAKIEDNAIEVLSEKLNLDKEQLIKAINPI